MPKNDINTLFENDQILLVNKPTGISVTADRSGKADILQLLAKQSAPSEPLRLVHRLDKETSGVLLIAKHKDAQSRYSRLFAKRKVRKAAQLMAPVSLNIAIKIIMPMISQITFQSTKAMDSSKSIMCRAGKKLPPI